MFDWREGFEATALIIALVGLPAVLIALLLW